MISIAAVSSQEGMVVLPGLTQSSLKLWGSNHLAPKAMEQLDDLCLYPLFQRISIQTADVGCERSSPIFLYKSFRESVHSKSSLSISRNSKTFELEGILTQELEFTYTDSRQNTKDFKNFQRVLEISLERKDYQLKIQEYDSSQLITKTLRDTLVTQISNDHQETEEERLFHQGSEQFKVGQVGLAIESWESALRILESTGNIQGVVVVTGLLGNAYRHLENYSQANEYFNKSLILAREIQSRAMEASALAGLGEIYQALEDYSTAISYFEQAIVIFREIEDHQTVAIFLEKLGIAYISNQEIEKAILIFQEYLELSKELQDFEKQLDALAILAEIYSRSTRTTEVIEYYQQRLSLSQEIQSYQEEISTLESIGDYYVHVRDYFKAVDFYDQALSIAKELGDLKQESFLLLKLGFAYEGFGNLSRAIDLAEQAFVINRWQGDTRSIV
ncbi:MAG: tetratricopeptide repeat protein [Cyanothece sp. SIO1E1]|nr:tetratricopeptide repeat protein [Cyanothece sp. SIO1E1]